MWNLKRRCWDWFLGKWLPLLDIYCYINSLSPGILSYTEFSLLVWPLRFFYIGGWARCLKLYGFKCPHLVLILKAEQTIFHPTHFTPWLQDIHWFFPVSLVLCNLSQRQLDPHPGSYPGNPAVSSWKMSLGTSSWVCKRCDWGRAAKPQHISSNTMSSFIVLLVDMSHFFTRTWIKISPTLTMQWDLLRKQTQLSIFISVFYGLPRISSKRKSFWFSHFSLTISLQTLT